MSEQNKMELNRYSFAISFDDYFRISEMIGRIGAISTHLPEDNHYNSMKGCLDTLREIVAKAQPFERFDNEATK